MEIFGICNACKRGVTGSAFVIYPAVSVALETLQIAIDSNPQIAISGWFPKPPAPDVPDHLPAAAARAFTEAEQLRIAGFRGPAGNAYRRALEAGLREVDPDLKGTLYARIEKLAETGRLTSNMKDFAHRVRTLGNEASHETPVVEDDEIDNLAIFTKLFLMYQFTLPGMLPPRAAE
ncbi:DUF4145 domain-containing protein [Paraburkholderia sp. XV]|uniref:DUF4145 domain-containing protein n=1 Tax=Paraburkholderia sp. XV TaxID=2831520 RepID=UPI001CD75F91|nr:DUF4145 domain-containing protein [Paraburkholderia sp. XV]